MKTFLMILGAAALTSVSVFAGENGSGYNGPDLHPVSIPVRLDRGISLASVREALKVCVASGNETIGLQSLLQNLAAQMGAAFENQSAFLKVNLYVENKVSFYPAGGRIQLPGVALPQQLTAGSSFSQTNQPSSLTISIYGSANTLDLGTSGDVIFPYISYDEILSEGTYDDFGNLNEESKILGGIQVKAGITSGQSLARVPVINQRTHVATKFTLNAEELMQCLQSELQKRASTGDGQ
jgi:hypothetical protein